MPAAGGALFTDLYQLNMMAACLEHGLTGEAAFELFVRGLPARRGFLMAAGLDQALRFLEQIALSRIGAPKLVADLDRHREHGR